MPGTAPYPSGIVPGADLPLVERMDVIVHFLAVLSCSSRVCGPAPADTFGDIEVLWCGPEAVSAGELELVDVYDG
ncbi:MAG: hypothetical protein R2789_07385 [Microthrixaceae bacterium]